MTNETRCVMPHIGLAVQNNGDFCACNLNTWSYTDRKMQPLYAFKDRLEDAWSSPTKKMIAIALDRGKKLDSCRVCHEAEDAGIVSTRQRLNETFKNTEPMLSQPRVMILKPGNVCNLACRMCDPNTSTGWYRDGYLLEKVKNPDLIEKEYYKSFANIRDGLSSRNVEFWRTIREWIPNFEFLDIYGGEPFLATALFDALTEVADVGLSKNVSLQFHTNATILDQKYLDILPKYKNVTIGLSIDSNRVEHVEYIRHPVKMSMLKNNIKQFKALADQHKNIKLNLAITVTPFNVFYMNEIQSELSKFGIEMSVNFVVRPDEYDVRHIPASVRYEIAETLRDQRVKNFILQTVPGCDIAWPKFWQLTQQLDAIRGQSFADTFPEFYEKIKPYV